METSMRNWKTTMKPSCNDGCITMDQIKIQRGIFQGDSFLPSNLFYMKDLKLNSKNKQKQVGELKIVTQFSDDIGMEFGLVECAKASFKKGKLTSTGNKIIDEETEIQELNQEGAYKYLGVDKSDGI